MSYTCTAGTVAVLSTIQVVNNRLTVTATIIDDYGSYCKYVMIINYH